MGGPIRGKIVVIDTVYSQNRLNNIDNSWNFMGTRSHP